MEYEDRDTLEINPEFDDAITGNTSKIKQLIESINIAESLDDDILKKIGQRCHEGYSVDEESRKEWKKQTQESIKLARQVTEEKTFPWPKAANIKLPLITDAAIKFAGRAYSEIIRDDQVVKGSVVGKDPDGQKAERSERVGGYMSWQLMSKETEWEADTDKLLHVLPVVGHLFRKRYYCTSEKRTKSELRLPDKVCVNAQASCLESSRRVTDIIDNVSNNDFVSSVRSGIWLDVELKPEETKEQKIERDALEDDDYYCFLEQQCWLDLDEDGFEEPYIVTFEKESQKVVRIVARYDESGIETNARGEIVSIKPKVIFVDYRFVPDLGGGYYGIGFGHMMEPLTKAANSIVNQLVDGGTLNNINGGYLSKEIKISGGRHSFNVGEWKRTNATAEQLSKGVYPLPTKEPSATLFNLLGLIMDLVRDLSSVKDVLSGDAPGLNVPATTVMALIEQGMKTFNAIYKRIYRSLKKEYEQLYALNYEYMDEQEYFTVLDDQRAVYRKDFEPESLDVIPVADPNMSSDMQRLARAEALKGGIGLPGIDPKPILRQWMEAMRVPSGDIEEILPEQDPNGVPPHLQSMMHDIEKKQADIEVKERELDLKEREIAVKEQEAHIKTFKALPEVMKILAEAESIEPGQQLAALKQLADVIFKEQKQSLDFINQQTSQAVPAT